MNDALLDELAADGFGHYLAGFIDGEGCFGIGRWSYRSTGRNGFYFRFSLNLRDDDRGILEECRRRTGIGIVGSHQRKGPSRPQASWAIQDKTGVLTLVEILDRFPLRAKKARDYAIWREGVMEWISVPRPRGRRDHASDWTRIEELKAELQAGRLYVPAQ